MADSYICSGATMKCSMGTSQAKLTVLPSRTVFLTGQPMANISDHISMVNLAPFGRCRSLGFPATASATAANHGTLTPMPCMHNTPFPWMSGKNDYIVKGNPALLKSSTCQCMWGGTISIADDGQRDTGASDLNKKEAEEFEKDQVKTEGLSTDDVLDGIQMALDVAGMVPVCGAAPDLLNAAVSALRGNWLDAGMSLIAAVPGVGDAVGGAKIVKKGVKLAAKKSSKKVVNLAEKKAGKIGRQIAQSDNVVKIPERSNAAKKNSTERAAQNNNSVVRMDNYKVEKKKQANGNEITTVTKVSENKSVTIRNSTDMGGVNSSPSGFDNSYNVNSIRSTSDSGSSTSKQESLDWSREGQIKKPVKGEGENVLKLPERTPKEKGKGDKLNIDA